jgi:NADPH-dependent ferric siderophore reductase
MGSSRVRVVVALAFTVWLLLPRPALAVRGARVSDISITNSLNDLLVSLTVRDAFSPRMREAVFSGVPTTFSFFIILTENRTFWADRTVADVTLTHTLKYNSLRRVFSVQRSWADTEGELFVSSFDEARRLMSEIEGFPLIPLDELQEGRRYELRAKAKLSKITLPFYLHHLLIMASLWAFETDWHRIEFVYE